MAGSRGSIDWEDVELFDVLQFDGTGRDEFDAFVKGGAAEAEAFFMNDGQPVHCLSTRFEGVNYRVSMLIGFASVRSMGYIATYNPNYFNQFTTRREGEEEEARKNRTNGRWLLSFWKALEHTKRTKGCLVQPLQADHKDGEYSDMQEVEKMMAEGMGIKVREFKFEAAEVSEIRPTVAQPAAFVTLTAAALALTAAADAQPDASVALTDAAASVRDAVAKTGVKHKEEKRNETAFKQRLEKFLFDNKIC